MKHGVAMRSQSEKGFTLIELMITVAVIAVLAAIALPSYRQHVIRGNRSAAKAAMMDIANREQQILLANRRYAAKDALVATGYAPPAEILDDYDWNVVAPAGGSPTFTITFTPKGAQAADGAALTLDDRGNKAPSAKWER